MPTLSVVTVTMNEERNLPGLFASLRAQTDHAFDFVVVDGASRDGTIGLLHANADLVTYFTSEPDFGFFDALNKAVRAVKTDYYLVVGADDTLSSNAVAQFKRAAESMPDLVIADVSIGGRIKSGYHPRKRWIGPGAMYTSHSVGSLIRTGLHAKFGYYSHKYAIYSDSFFLKTVMVAPSSKVIAADFVSGIFCTTGFSSANFVRSLCELWLVQRETGENPLIQFFLFQARVLRNLLQVVRR